MPAPSQTRRRRHQSAGQPAEQPSPSPNPSQPDPSPSPSPSASGDGERSASSPPASSAAADFIADPGPAFDPKRSPAAPVVEEPDDAPAGEDEWDVARVRELLELQGEVTHAALQVGADDETTWIHTERDLRAIAPPLTRILNRYDATRAAAAAGDELLLAAALGRYGVRNFKTRRRLIAHQALQGPVPVTGVAAEPDTGPEVDEDWQRVHAGLPVDAPPDITPRGGRR